MLRELAIILNMDATLRTPHFDQELLQLAIEGLHRTTGLTAEGWGQDRDGDRHHRPDAAIEIDVEGHKHHYLVEIKPIDRFATLGMLKQKLMRFDERALLLAPRVTAEAADRCRELDIQFLDAAGNAYLHGPGLFVFVKGQRLPEDAHELAATKLGAGTPTALRMVFALLCRPLLLTAPYREIVDAAGVALGAVKLVFNDLETRGFTTGLKDKGGRRLREPERVLEEWVTNYPIKLRPKLKPRRFRAENPDWWQHANLARYGAQWGGEVAADRLTHYLKPATQTLYIKPAKGQPDLLTKLVIDQRLRADPKGDIEVLNAFWNLPDEAADPEIVPPLLVYADLIATMDPRNLETARLIREKFIDDVLRQF